MKLTQIHAYPAVSPERPIDVPALVTALAPAQPAHLRRRPLSLVAVVDVSSSMAGEPLQGVKQALGCLEENLVPGDHLALISYASEARVELPMTEVSAATRAQLREAIRRLRARGSTNMAAGLDLAVAQLALVPPELTGRAILLSDGQPNQGRVTDREGLASLITKGFGRHGLSCLGYSGHCDQELMEELSDTGRGGYAFIDSLDSTLDAFARELGGLISSYAMNVVIEVEQPGQPLQRDALGQILYGGEASLLVQLRHTGLPRGEGRELGVMRVKYQDRRGDMQCLETPLRMDVGDVQPDPEMDPRVQRAVDERRLAEAQTQAEILAGQGEFEAAMKLLDDVAGTLVIPELVSLVRDHLLREYDHAAYEGSSQARHSLKRRLKKKRMLMGTIDYLEERFADRAGLTVQEAAMREAFRNPPGEDEGPGSSE